jgi:hypothetical protein
MEVAVVAGGAQMCAPPSGRIFVRERGEPITRINISDRRFATVKSLEISVHDHIIVGKDGHASFKGLKLT